MRSLLGFFRPIDDANLPTLRDNLTRAAKAFSLLSAAVTPPMAIILVCAGQARPLSALLASSIELLAALLLYRAALAGRIHPERILFAQATTVVFSCALQGATTIDRGGDAMAYVGTIVLVITTFVPWRPALSLGLSLTAVSSVLIASRLLGLPLPIRLNTLLFGIVAAGMFSGVGTQLQRRLWQHLERARSQLVATERMSALGRMTAGIAHELKTPLAAALNGLERSQRLTAELRESIGHAGVTPDDLREIAAEMDATVVLLGSSLGRASKFVHAIRSQTVSSNTSVCVEFKLGARVDVVTALLGHRVKKSRVTIDTSGIDATTRMQGDPTKLEQILTNLVGNALDACDESARGSRVVISAEQRKGGVLIAVEDDGPGVPAALREKIFEPLFTTRASGDGTGLGLYISKEIAESTFGGTLRLAADAKGTRFELWCPERGARAVTDAAWAPPFAALAPSAS